MGKFYLYVYLVCFPNYSVLIRTRFSPTRLYHSYILNQS